MSEHTITVDGKKLKVSITKHKRDGGIHVAQCADPNVASQGETEEKALASITEALGLYFEKEAEIVAERAATAAAETKPEV